MYLTHFGIKELPFGLTPNTQFFCGLSGHQDAFNVLLFSLKTGEGFIKITGEVGTGKTLLCRKLLSALPDNFETAYLPNPALDASSLRLAFAKELGLDLPSISNQSDVLEAITKKLLSLKHHNKNLVLIIDEAQALPDETLESLRLLTNLETESEKLLQIVLFGQPELDARLKQHQFRQLQQRITFSHHLGPIDRSQLQEYLCHRLAMAGHTTGSLFDTAATDLLFKASGGIPRVVNILCHKALLSAYGKGVHQVDNSAMMKAIEDSSDIVNPLVAVTTAKKGLPVFGKPQIVFGLVVLAAVAILALHFLR